MDGEDEIEDLSVDKALEEEDKKLMEEKQKAANPTKTGGLNLEDLMSASGIPKIFTDDDEFEADDYAEEYTDKNGNHIRKEVHKGPGWTSFSLSSGGSSGGPMGSDGPMGGANPLDPFSAMDAMVE